MCDTPRALSKSRLLFRMSLPAVKAGVNGLIPAGVAVYDDKELGLALTYLEEEENKVMLSEGDLYRI